MKVPSVPSIDIDASLKIESEKVVSEDLPEREKEGKILLVLGTIVGIFVLIGVGVLGFIYFRIPEKKESVVEVSPTPQISEIPKTILKNEEISFEILNASGKSGEAARIQKRVEVLGYKVKSIGNSEKKISGMEVYLSMKLDEQKDLLVTDLKKEFPDLSYAGVLESNDIQARIVVGR